ncbi:hypothetical protein AB685_17730 [Bacillus sp. LL01]|nr:hypothetical protein AB685_17730 [Bacillus sp. LL01]
MIIRKLLTYFLACILVPALISVWSLPSISEFLGVFWLLFLYGAPFLLLYGLPVSCLSDMVTQKISPSIRAFIAFVIHLFFGLILIFILHLFNNEAWDNLSRLFLICSTVGSFLVWGIDEILRKVADWETIQSGM